MLSLAFHIKEVPHLSFSTLLSANLIFSDCLPSGMGSKMSVFAYGVVEGCVHGSLGCAWLPTPCSAFWDNPSPCGDKQARGSRTSRGCKDAVHLQVCSEEPGSWHFFFPQLAVCDINKALWFGRRLSDVSKEWAELLLTLCRAHTHQNSLLSGSTAPLEQGKKRHTASNSTSITLHFESSLERCKWGKNILDDF